MYRHLLYSLQWNIEIYSMNIACILICYIFISVEIYKSDISIKLSENELSPQAPSFQTGTRSPTTSIMYKKKSLTMN